MLNFAGFLLDFCSSFARVLLALGRGGDLDFAHLFVDFCSIFARVLLALEGEGA